MYRQAEQTINHGLSFGARLLLSAFAALFGVIMLLTATSTSRAPFSYLLGIFCLLIAVACLTTGRARQFVGSFIGIAIFGLGIWYLGIELLRGNYWSNARGEPSALNACLYLIFIGIPGAAYAYRARFGLGRKPTAQRSIDG